MKTKLRTLIGKFLRPLLQWYLSKSRRYSYQGLIVEVYPGVFHPAFFFSSKLMLKYLSKQNLKAKRVLELGAGSGLIALFVHRQGGELVATDISNTAVQNILKNQQLNASHFTVIQSDLFDRIPKQDFDLILVNPPYYKKDPVNEAEYAWYCGKNLEYFKRLFTGLRAYMHSETELVMVLSEVCEIDEIQTLALEHGFEFERVLTQEHWFENNFIYRIRQKHHP